jgi:poly-gamma-glutamate capsule biosynthesis protein CapA/YwtB (metallophosphatase superfamily)
MDGRFLSPPEALDALQTFGFNLVSLSNNHAFDLKVPGIREHAPGGSPAETGSCRDRQHH